MYMRKFVSVLIVLLFFSIGATDGNPPDLISKNKMNGCSFKGINLYGKVQFVNSFPDIKIQVVNSFPDLKVQYVKSFPDKCGKWQRVDSFPDFKVQVVDSFPDIKIKHVSSFPGI